MIFYVRPVFRYKLETNQLELLHPVSGRMLSPKIELRACNGATILLYEESDPLAESVGVLNLIPGDYDTEDLLAVCAKQLGKRSIAIDVNVRMKPRPNIGPG